MDTITFSVMLHVNRLPRPAQLDRPGELYTLYDGTRPREEPRRADRLFHQT